MNSEHRHTSDMGRPERLIKRSGWPATFCPNLPLKADALIPAACR